MYTKANIIIDLVAILVIACILSNDYKQSHEKTLVSSLLRRLLFNVGAVLTVDIFAWLIDGNVFFGARALSYCLNTAYYILQVLYCWQWILFVDYWVHHSLERLNKRRLVYLFPLLIQLVMIVANIWTGWLFTVDESTVYARGRFYLINTVPYYVYILAALCIALIAYVKSTDSDDRRQTLSLLIFMLLPICGTILETVRFGVSWLWPFSALSLLMVYLNVWQQRLAEQRILSLRMENELIQSRIATMLSQIQPHFLYNALSTIKILCRIDPRTAEKATEDFTNFLRGNMDSLTNDRPISFEQELLHTEHYLSLEKLRFQERLNVEYDVKTKDFRLPTLSLQPIVENAVRYGVTKREEGGTVTIAAYETADAFIVSVSDDGVGFDPAQTLSNDRNHVGIANVRNRLEAMCGGSLEIKSEPNVGTTVTIAIPKGEQA